MEAKKSLRADLEKKKGLLFQIGLCTSLLLMILAFSYSKSEIVYEEMTVAREIVEMEMVEITREEITPPEPVRQEVQVVADLINIVSDDRKIETNLSFADFDQDVDFVFQPATSSRTMEEAADEIIDFMVIEDQPLFQGQDVNAFRSWINSKIAYPVVAAENGMQGTVTVSFIIEKDGTLAELSVIASPDRSLSEEAIRVISSSPKWTPGKQRGVPVRVRYSLPVIFRLTN